jgi:hypothetical protein
VNKLKNRELLHLVTSYLLEHRGYSKKTDEYDIEWDAKEPDSQFSLCYEDVEIVFEALNKLGYQIVSATPPVGPVGYTKVSSTVSVSGPHVHIK